MRPLGGRLVQPGSGDALEQRAANIVQEMALAANMPAPSLFVLDEEPGINAFAAGTTPANAVVAVTRGALTTLNRDQLQGVIGHEFSHILNGDMRSASPSRHAPWHYFLSVMWAAYSCAAHPTVDATEAVVKMTIVAPFWLSVSAFI